MHEFVSAVKESLQSKSDLKKAQWLENYVKHNIRSLGVGIPDIRHIIKEQENIFSLRNESLTHQFKILTGLMAGDYAEEKLAAIIYLQLYFKSGSESEVLGLVSSWFDQNYIYDWNVCDWLCVRVLTPFINSASAKSIPEFKKWNSSENLWKARASLVPFAPLKNITEYADEIYAFSAALITRKERFCKTAVGWVMREVSRYDKSYVSRFLSEFSEHTTPEVVKNATKYF